MSAIHFLDTSVLVELLDVPHMNARHNAAESEYQQLAHNGDTFILPIATLIETGNHIAQIPDGNIRRRIASNFTLLTLQAVNWENNWNIIPSISQEILKTILNQFPDYVTTKTGLGDLSIITQFEDYWQNKQPIGSMRIWSFDTHLSSYQHTGGLSRRKFN